MNVIFGASGHAREISWIISNSLDSDINTNAQLFVLESLPNDITIDFSLVSEIELTNLISDENSEQQWYAYVAIGSGAIRKKIVDKFIGYRLINFPNLIADSVVMNVNTVKTGHGNIFFPLTIITTHIFIGNHNHFNLKVSISHECKIGNFNTFSPGVTIAGNVKIGNNNFFGINSCVIDGITIADNIIIGAGAVVIHDLLFPGTYVGIPAKKIK